MYRTVVPICTASLTFNNSTFYPHSVFKCFMWISEQTDIISLYIINWLVFVTETVCVYCAVRTGYLNKLDTNSVFRVFNIPSVWKLRSALSPFMLPQRSLSSPLSYSDIAICEIIAPSSRGSIVTFYSQASPYHCCHLPYIPYNPLTLPLRFWSSRERRNTQKRNIKESKSENLNCLVQNLNSTSVIISTSVLFIQLNRLQALHDTSSGLLNNKPPTFKKSLSEQNPLAFRVVLLL